MRSPYKLPTLSDAEMIDRHTLYRKLWPREPSKVRHSAAKERQRFASVLARAAKGSREQTAEHVISAPNS